MNGSKGQRNAAICVCAAILIFLSVLCFRVGQTDFGAGDTMERIEDDNSRARDELNDATGEIDNAENVLDKTDAGINGAIGEIQDGDSERQTILDECQAIVRRSQEGLERAGEIVTDVEDANRKDTEADGNSQTAKKPMGSDGH